MQPKKLFIPEGLSCKSPYVYWIEHIPSKRLYHGLKYSEASCDSSTFMTKSGYQTSSKNIWPLIRRDGLDSFRVLCVRHFATPKEVIAYEYNFLHKVDAKNNPRYINQNNGGKSFYNGPHTEETKKKISDTKNNKSLEEKKAINQKLRKAITGKRATEETKRKLSESQKNSLTPELSKKRSNSAKNRFSSSEERQKLRDYINNRSLEERVSCEEKRQKTINNRSLEQRIAIGQKISEAKKNKSLADKNITSMNMSLGRKGKKLYDKIGEKSKYFKVQPDDPDWTLRSKKKKSLDL